MVFAPSLTHLKAVVSQATTLWAGMYQPFLAPADATSLRSKAGRYGVDILHGLDGAFAAISDAELDGFRWRGSDDWGPLAPAKDFTNSRLLGPESFADDWPASESVLPDWNADDPLDSLFRVWFGHYDNSQEQAANLRLDFASRSTQVTIPLNDSIPPGVTSWYTPIIATAAEIDYRGEAPGPGFVIVEPSDVESLQIFWNARAIGANVFPWPLGYENRVSAAAKRWLDELLGSGQLNRWRSGDGREIGPRIEVWHSNKRVAPPSAGGQQVPERPLRPDSLTTFLSDNSVEHMMFSFDEAFEISGGWRGPHPFVTRFENFFSQPIETDGAVLLQLPGLSVVKERPSRPRGDVVAIHVTLDGVSGLRPDWTFTVPNVRALAPFVARYDGTLLHFDRPTSCGRALSGSMHDRTTRLSAVPSSDLFGKVIEADGWSSEQTQDGVFITRLIERLGGPASTIANQPGARAGLIQVARSPQGQRSGAIVQYITRFKGSWPDPLRSERVQADYAAGVFRYLLGRGLLRPVLPVSCPHCGTSVSVRPEDLRTEMRCDLCLQDYPLGLALGHRTSARNEWLYQLAGHVDQARLREVLAVMAVVQVFTASWRTSASVVPHLLGWRVSGPELHCEVDIVVARDEGGIPVFVVGEVKYYRDSINSVDLANLGRLQDHIRSKGIECFVLVAVLRDLRPEEKEAIREFADRPVRTLPLRSSVEPVLPIVLTEADLSVHSFDDHPMRWGGPGSGISGLARESCRRNLDLVDVEFRSGDATDWHYQSVWD
jgi:hypothetical protein